MFILFAHAGHTHEMGSMGSIDHCMPIVIGTGVIVAMLIATIAYLLTAWQPKKPRKTTQTKISKK